jgi:hypothetical protein
MGYSDGCRMERTQLGLPKLELLPASIHLQQMCTSSCCRMKRPSGFHLMNTILPSCIPKRRDNGSNGPSMLMNWG